MGEESALWYSSLDGLSLFARRFSATSRRTAVLCLHNAAQTSRCFLPLAKEISSKRTVLAPDLRGHGRSDYPIDLTSYSIDTLAEDATQLLAVEEIQTAIVIGCGLGGILALKLASLRPRVVSAIILCEASPDLAPGTIIRDDALPGEDWDPAAAPYLARALGETKCWPLFDDARTKPILALRGARSRTTGKASLEAMAQRKSDLRCVTIAGSADASGFDDPEILKPIKAFIANLP